MLAIVATLNLVRSRIGRAFVAVRDQDIAAEIIGINIYRYKLLAFAISSFYAGVCGVLYTYYFGIANYEQFQLIVSIDYPRHDHHRRPGLGAGLDLRRGFRHLAADRDPHLDGECRRRCSSPARRWPTSSRACGWRVFGGLIIFFLVVEPEGLNRLWRNIRSYFRVWPFSY